MRENHRGTYLQSRRSLGSQKLQADQFNFSGVQINGTRHNKIYVYKTNVGRLGQHGFRPGYSCESQIISVCQDIADSLDEAVRLDAIIIDSRELQCREQTQEQSYGLRDF
jgi:hypothetical protein